MSGYQEEVVGGEFWSDGFYVVTVSEHGNEKVIANYVKKQGYKNHYYLIRLVI